MRRFFIHLVIPVLLRVAFASSPHRSGVRKWPDRFHAAIAPTCRDELCLIKAQ